MKHRKKRRKRVKPPKVKPGVCGGCGTAVVHMHEIKPGWSDYSGYDPVLEKKLFLWGHHYGAAGQLLEVTCLRCVVGW